MSLAQQETVQKLTFESESAPVAKVLEKLSTKMGQKLTASPVFGNETLLVSVHDGTQRMVMDKIAEATVGKWVTVKDGFRLDRDTDKWREVASLEYAKRRDGMAKAIQSYTDSHKADATWDSKRAAELVKAEIDSRQQLLDHLKQNDPNILDHQVHITKGSSNDVTPATSALMEVLAKLPVDSIASLGAGQRVVYSSRPTRMQKSLPISAQSLIDKFVQAQNVLAAAASSGPAAPDNITVNGGLDLAAKPINSVQGKVLVILTRRSSDPGVTVEVQFSDASGNIMGQAYRWLSPEDQIPEANPAVKVTHDDTIPCSALSQEIAKALVSSQGSTSNSSNEMTIGSKSGFVTLSTNGPMPGPSLSAEALACLSNPSQSDPQSTFCSDLVLGAVKAAGVNFVGSLPDAALVPLARVAVTGCKPSSVWNGLSSNLTRLQLSDGWIVATPADRLEQSAEQMDRNAATALFGTIVRRGYPRLYDLAKFSLSLGQNPKTTNFGVVVLKLLDPYAASDLSHNIGSNPQLFQFLATLGENAFNRSTGETKFQILGMNSEQRRDMEAVAFGGDTIGGIIGQGDFVGISVTDGPGPSPSREAGPTLANEPTEAMPDGLPALATITLQFTSADLVFAAVSGSRGGEFLSAEGLGTMQSAQSSGRFQDVDLKIPGFDRFTAAQGNSIVMTREFIAGRPAVSNYADGWLVPGSSTVTFDKLPSGFRNAVAKAKDEMSKGRTVRFGPGQRPPH